MSIRTNWARDSMIIPNTRCSPLMPAAEKVPGVPFRLGSKVIVDATHLPARDETEKWEYDRVWPMGKDTVQLRDFVENYAGGGTAQLRLVPPAARPSDPPPLASAGPHTASLTNRGERTSAGAHSEYVAVGKLADIPEKAGRCVKLGKRQIALFKLDGQLYAINNICPHQGGALAEGELEGNTIMCPLHGWVYDVTTGEVLNGEQSVDSYPVQIDGDQVKVCLPR
jgi:NAD(P)H-dependent nitrite reductase small subunit